ncbi:acyl-CoA dehydrogenase family protein [Bradyrhizobium sp. 21]|uniref:acyl-CoA dehydrogenase family protein n=1 Tax=Bradyrhizobium sp. 21 TaxID=2782666 RepID=UPI001FF817AD|nr:acyl-CoA dehydrogenase family protein [Bradyrhizobium sp. 21]MCK1387659.1 hypothetical protein [Bradyrhizobium sp. 21]
MKPGFDKSDLSFRAAIRRSLVAATKGGVAEVWRVLNSIDAFSFALPLDSGGLDLGEPAIIHVVEELGRLACSTPFMEFVDSLMCAADQGTRRELALLLQHDEPVGVVDLEAASSCPTNGDRHPVCRLNGFAMHQRCPVAARVLVRHHTKQGTSLHIASSGMTGFEVAAVHDAWGSGYGHVTLENAELARIGVFRNSAERSARVQIRQAGYLVGLSAGALEHAAAHANARHLFGRPLVDQQSVAFRLASLAARISAARLLVHRAASEPPGEELERLALQSLLLASVVARDTGQVTMQLHGSGGLLSTSQASRFYMMISIERNRMESALELSHRVGKLYLGQVQTPRDSRPEPDCELLGAVQ